MDRVRLAIVGCGNISQLNAPGYLQHPRCDVVALCDTDPERAKRRARDWGITPRVYSDFAQVLDDAAVDAVELLTPTWMHADQIVAALGAGKHVSAQKPLAVSIAEADRIAAAVARARTTFRVTENFLYYPPILKAKELLDAGAIGEPSLVRIHTTRAQHITGQAIELDPDALVWRRDPGRNPGGALYDDGVHKYATAALWIGEIGDGLRDREPGRGLHPGDAERGHVALQGARLPGHHRLHLRARDDDPLAATTAPTSSSRSTARRGIIWVTRCTGEMLDMPAVMVLRGTETISYQVPTDWRLGFDGAAADFVDGLLEGRQPAQDVHAARRMLQVPLAIYEAARTGRAVAPDVDQVASAQRFSAGVDVAGPMPHTWMTSPRPWRRRSAPCPRSG